MEYIVFGTNETTIRATVREIEQETSKFTGKSINKYVVSFTASDERDSDLVSGLKAKDQVYLFDPSNKPVGRCTTLQKSSSFTAGNPETNFVWELREIEDLTIEKVSLGGIELLPYRYKESLDGDALMIDMRVRITPDVRDRIEKLPHYFEVIRFGISDLPRTMRLGRGLWSESEGTINQQVYLVEQLFDKPGEHGLFEPERSNWHFMLIKVTHKLDSLLQLLSTKGLLNEEEIASLDEFPDDARVRLVREFDRVKDLDEWQ
jgi:hypothetical protein